MDNKPSKELTVVSPALNRFKDTGYGNSILKGDDFYISFNADLKATLGPGMALFDSDNSQAETALVINGQFLILNGDWREQYALAASQGKDAVLKVYKDNLSSRSSWSEDTPPDDITIEV